MKTRRGQIKTHPRLQVLSFIQIQMSPTLEGQTILIGGGSSGIGFGVALASLNAGAATVIIGSSQKENVDGAVERLKAQEARMQALSRVL